MFQLINRLFKTLVITSLGILIISCGTTSSNNDISPNNPIISGMVLPNGFSVSQFQQYIYEGETFVEKPLIIDTPESIKTFKNTNNDNATVDQFYLITSKIENTNNFLLHVMAKNDDSKTSVINNYPTYRIKKNLLLASYGESTDLYMIGEDSSIQLINDIVQNICCGLTPQQITFQLYENNTESNLDVLDMKIHSDNIYFYVQNNQNNQQILVKNSITSSSNHVVYDVPSAQSDSEHLLIIPTSNSRGEVSFSLSKYSEVYYQTINQDVFIDYNDTIFSIEKNENEAFEIVNYQINDNGEKINKTLFASNSSQWKPVYLEISPDGKLWVTDQSTNSFYIIKKGLIND